LNADATASCLKRAVSYHPCRVVGSNLRCIDHRSRAMPKRNILICVFDRGGLAPRACCVSMPRQSRPIVMNHREKKMDTAAGVRHLDVVEESACAPLGVGTGRAFGARSQFCLPMQGSQLRMLA